MNNDLVSKQDIFKRFKNSDSFFNMISHINNSEDIMLAMSQFIDKIPISYDIDKVVDEVCSDTYDVQYNSDAEEVEKIINGGGFGNENELEFDDI